MKAAPAPNAVGSVLKTGSGFFVAVLLPPFLVRSLSEDAFVLWALSVQLTGYIVLLELGTSTGVARLVAKAQERSWVVASAAMPLAIASSLIGLASSAVLAWWIPQVLLGHRHLSHLHPGVVVLLLGLGNSLVVLAAPVLGRASGRLSLFWPGLSLAVAKGLGAIAVVALAVHGSSLLLLALIWTGFTLITPVVLVSHPKLWTSRRAHSDPDYGRELRSFSGTFALWAFSGFLVSGLDTAIVARFDFETAASYALALVVPTLIAAVTSALTTPLVPRFSALDSPQGQAQLLALLRQRADLCSTALALICALVVVWADDLVQGLAGTSVPTATVVIRLLVTATWLRLSIQPFSMFVLALGEHVKARFVPLAEGLGNLAASLALVGPLGARGVAVGTVVGALLGLAANRFILLPRLDRLPQASRSWLLTPLVRSSALMVLGGAGPWLLQGGGMTQHGACVIISLAVVGLAIRLLGVTRVASRV